MSAELVRVPWATGRLIVSVAEDGKARELFCIDLDSLPMWLATIEASRVAEDVRPKLEAYQCRAAKVLRDHFFGAVAELDRLATVEARLAALEASLRGKGKGLNLPRWRLTAPEPSAQLIASVLDVIRDHQGIRVHRLHVTFSTMGVDPDTVDAAVQLLIQRREVFSRGHHRSTVYYAPFNRGETQIDAAPLRSN